MPIFFFYRKVNTVLFKLCTLHQIYDDISEKCEHKVCCPGAYRRDGADLSVKCQHEIADGL